MYGCPRTWTVPHYQLLGQEEELRASLQPYQDTKAADDHCLLHNTRKDMEAG